MVTSLNVEGMRPCVPSMVRPESDEGLTFWKSQRAVAVVDTFCTTLIL